MDRRRKDHTKSRPHPFQENPPVAVKVVDDPTQMLVVPEIPVGGVESVLTVTVIEAQPVVLQVPAYLTK
ncbi:MAG: hypothetical protein IPN95_27780 [Bacteroidetes bacterium]|nr:hypothetical protein [Bacteroidota bacterium]